MVIFYPDKQLFQRNFCLIMIKLPTLISNNPRLAFYPFLAVAASGFGQTFFISVMGGELRQDFGMGVTALSISMAAVVLVVSFLSSIPVLSQKKNIVDPS